MEHTIITEDKPGPMFRRHETHVRLRLVLWPPVQPVGTDADDCCDGRSVSVCVVGGSSGGSTKHTVLLLVNGGVVEIVLHNLEDGLVAVDQGVNDISGCRPGAGFWCANKRATKFAVVVDPGCRGRHGSCHDAVLQVGGCPAWRWCCCCWRGTTMTQRGTRVQLVVRVLLQIVQLLLAGSVLGLEQFCLDLVPGPDAHGQALGKVVAVANGLDDAALGAGVPDVDPADGSRREARYGTVSTVGTTVVGQQLGGLCLVQVVRHPGVVVAKLDDKVASRLCKGSVDGLGIDGLVVKVAKGMSDVVGRAVWLDRVWLWWWRWRWWSRRSARRIDWVKGRPRYL